jgi:hypothetical protein
MYDLDDVTHIVDKCFNCKTFFVKGNIIWESIIDRMGRKEKVFEEPFREDNEWGSIYFCNKCNDKHLNLVGDKGDKAVCNLNNDIDCVQCFECGEFITDCIKKNNIGVLKFEKGYIGNRDEPSEDGYIYFICMNCFEAI